MKDEYIKIILDFVEGRTTAEQFWNIFQNNQDLHNVIIDDLNKNKMPGAFFDPIAFLGENINPLGYGDSLELYGIAKIVLKHAGVSYSDYTFYSDRYGFLIKMQPEWLDLYNNEEFLIRIVNSAPEDLNKAQKLKWCKEKLLELFRYDSKPPRWVQSPEWPIQNGKPLVFREQSRERKESDLVKFFFYDPETKEETVVEQYY